MPAQVSPQKPNPLNNTQLSTWEDYLALPDDGLRYELLEGVLCMVPSPSRIHQEIVGQLHLQIAQHLKYRNLGKVFIAPFDVKLSDTNVVQPDLIYLRSENLGILTEQNICGVPDLVVEVLSPSTAVRDRLHKMSSYAKFGIKEYWVVWPREQIIEVLSLENGIFQTQKVLTTADVLTTEIIPGLEIKLCELWEE
jgi:Uma2 family endonuclease